MTFSTTSDAAWRRGLKNGLKSLGIASLLVLAGCTTSQVTTGYYDVKGNTAKRLDREFRSKGPANGHALASAAIRFEPLTLDYRQTATSCSVERSKIKVIANITLPRWLDRRGSDRELRAAFDNLAAYAKAHEEFHVKIAETAARDMEKSLKALSPSRTCKALDKRIERLIKVKLKEHDQAQKQFDRLEQIRLKALFDQAERRTS